MRQDAKNKNKKIFHLFSFYFILPYIIVGNFKYLIVMSQVDCHIHK